MNNMQGPYCATCRHEAAAIINAELINGTATFQELGRRYGISPRAVWNHSRHHLGNVKIARARGPRGTKYKSES